MTTDPVIDLLTPDEHKVLDRVFEAAFRAASERNVGLANGEECIEAGEAIARWLIASRNL